MRRPDPAERIAKLCRTTQSRMGSAANFLNWASGALEIGGLAPSKFNTGEILTIGMDISGGSCPVVALAQENGELVWERKVATRAPGLQKFFGQVPASRIALEAGSHSGWMCRLLSSLGHEVWVANARQLQLIYENK